MSCFSEVAVCLVLCSVSKMSVCPCADVMTSQKLGWGQKVVKVLVCGQAWVGISSEPKSQFWEARDCAFTIREAKESLKELVAQA